ncbi:MAG: prolyl oligopeptidase family serine peptidase, partial [Chloroflexota bacterium]
GQIRDALAIFHGSEDKAVPVVQSEAMAAQLRKSGAPHLLQVYPGEGHGFRAPEVIEDLYRQIERFLQDHVLFG